MEFKHRHNQCCNPMKLEKHRITKGVRIASIQLQQSWNLSDSDYLCRKRMLLLKPVASSSSNVNERCHVNETSFDSSDDDVENEARSEFSTSSQLSVGTQLSVVNQALSLLNISPIDAYSIDKPSYLKGRYDDICSRFATLLGLQDKCNNYENSLNCKGILNNLKQKIDDKGTTRDQKIQILTLLPVDWSINQICDIMGATKHMAVASKNLTEKEGVMSAPKAKKGRTLSDDIKTKVLEFYESDDVSVNLPGKKNFLSVRNDDGQRHHMQKRLILCNLKELYHTFKEQYPTYCLGFSTFASLRPIHCVLAGSSSTHTICVCAIHQNIKLMMSGSNLAALTHDQTVPLLHYSDCFKVVLCPYPSSDCYFGKCAQCPGIDVLQNVLGTVFEENVVENITYYNIAYHRMSLFSYFCHISKM